MFNHSNYLELSKAITTYIKELENILNTTIASKNERDLMKQVIQDLKIIML